MTWNKCRELVRKSSDPVELLLVRVLDGWVDYVREARDGERYIELDVMDDMAHDIAVYRRELMKMMEGEEDGGR